MDHLSRRNFPKAKAAAVAATAAGVSLLASAANIVTGDELEPKWSEAPCRFRGTGCGVMVAVKESRVVATHAGDMQAEVNRGLNCVKGCFLSKIMYGADRLTTPLLRTRNRRFDKDGEFTPVSWDDALAAALPAAAQGIGGTAPSASDLRALDPASFLAVAASLAMFEIEANGQALRAATRPELVELARDTVQLQGEVMQRLRGAALERGLALPGAMSLEHRAVLEGLAPPDGEGLERRYAEAQVEVLGQSVQLYRAAAGQGGDARLKSVAGEILPRLERQAQAAQRALRLVRLS